MAVKFLQATRTLRTLMFTRTRTPFVCLSAGDEGHGHEHSLMTSRSLLTTFIVSLAMAFCFMSFTHFSLALIHSPTHALKEHTTHPRSEGATRHPYHHHHPYHAHHTIIISLL